MKDYPLWLQYALVGLDGQSSLHMTTAKSAVLRAVAAGKLLEEQLWGKSEEELDAMDRTQWKERLEEGLKDVCQMKKKEAQELEQETAGLLIADGSMEEAPDILGADMNYYTADVSMKVYRTVRETYLGITERIRAEILEEGPVTLEAVCMLWLLRESECIHDLFSVEEQNVIHRRMLDASSKRELYRVLWQTEFHDRWEHFAAGFLRGKKNLFSNPYLEGVVLLFPFLERRQAIFIDFVVLGSNVMSRRMEVMTFLCERGHYVEDVKFGEETLLRVDNIYYRIFPKTVQVRHIPIQGVCLIPAYM
ncbi:MAG: hypothetical protein Q4F28_04500 [Eubacteriales bacterium]|nr:hypothetical protein [Eubacteriales bacterium]